MKIFDLDKTLLEIERLKLQNLKIILVGGCFDILHPGHIEFLTKAKSKGDILIVALEPDSKVKLLKGDKRPINKQSDRAEELAKLPFVDIVLLLSLLKTDEDYFNFVKEIKPDVIAITEDDININKKRKQIESIGGKLIIVTPRLKDYSTSKIVSEANNNF